MQRGPGDDRVRLFCMRRRWFAPSARVFGQGQSRKLPRWARARFGRTLPSRNRVRSITTETRKHGDLERVGIASIRTKQGRFCPKILRVPSVSLCLCGENFCPGGYLPKWRCNQVAGIKNGPHVSAGAAFSSVVLCVLDSPILVARRTRCWYQRISRYDWFTHPSCPSTTICTQVWSSTSSDGPESCTLSPRFRVVTLL